MAKRAMDLVLGTVAAVLTLPIMLAIAAAIRLTSPGPALFRQDRTTVHGRRFKILKFRTMEADAEVSVEDTTAPFFKMADDPRITRVGRFIRPFSLDELPQLWNVLRGDMSLVGPRPLPADQVDANDELLGPRHDVPAGMTGWWQVNGRSDLPAEEAVVFDRFYIENWSVGLDLRILVKTIGVLFDRRGAY
jgi:lipopolysaccharide/colanic/teichoic acid biosynthesis glycosyltransferase